MTMLVYTVGALTLIAFLWLVGGSRRIGAISPGKPIGDRSGTALILIDLQEIFWEHGAYTLYFWFVAILTLLTGGWVFRRLKPHFADVL